MTKTKVSHSQNNQTKCKRDNNSSSIRLTALTVLHGHALIFDPADVATEFILALRVFDQLCFHAEAPHLLQSVPLKFHLVQDLGTHFHHLVGVQLCDKDGVINDVVRGREGMWWCHKKLRL